MMMVTGRGVVFWNCLEKLLQAFFLICDFVAEHPRASFVVCQIMILAIVCFWLCPNRYTPQVEGLRAKADEAELPSATAATAPAAANITVTVEGF